MAYSEDDYLMISGLQHYCFCKRQWALIHISQAWDDNALTMEGNLLHIKSDDPFIVETRGDTFISRAVTVASRSLGLTGVLDVLEFKRTDHGVTLPGKDGFWHPNIVEYKHGKPKKNKCDLMQLTAQVVCLEEMLCCSIQSADLFYAIPNRRTTVQIDIKLRQELKVLIHELHGLYATGALPQAESYRNCSKCSLYEICMPWVSKKPRSVSNYIAAALEEPYA